MILTLFILIIALILFSLFIFLYIRWHIKLYGKNAGDNSEWQLILSQNPHWVSFEIQYQNPIISFSLRLGSKRLNLKKFKRSNHKTIQNTKVFSTSVSKNKHTFFLPAISTEKLLKHLKQSIHVQRFDCYCEYGLNNAAQTGILFGYIVSIIHLLPEPVFLNIQPNFVKRCLNYEIQLSINVRLLYILIELIFNLKVLRYIKK